MADYIEREAVRNELYDADAITMCGVAILNNFPAADVVEVVRCKDCKHHEHYDALLYCGHIRGLAGSVSPDAFCSYGERKDNDIQTV